MKKWQRKVFVIFLLAIGLWLAFSLSGDVTGPSSIFQIMQKLLSRVEEVYRESPLLVFGVFALSLLIASVVGLPPPGLVSVAAGAVLGFQAAFLLSLPIAALGAVLPFLVSRKLIGPILERRFPQKIQAMQAGLMTDGPLYLFSLRLVPLVPFPLVNLFMGVTNIHISTFILVSMLGRFPLTALYCNAGTQISSLRSSDDILTPAVVISLATLAVFPHLARRLLWRLTPKWRLNRLQ